MLTVTTAKVAIHQVDEYVWCDTHDEIHDRTPTRRTERGFDPRLCCNADAWRPVFTTDSKLGVL